MQASAPESPQARNARLEAEVRRLEAEVRRWEEDYRWLEAGMVRLYFRIVALRENCTCGAYVPAPPEEVVVREEVEAGEEVIVVEDSSSDEELIVVEDTSPDDDRKQ